MPFDMGDLSIPGFGYPQAGTNPMSVSRDDCINIVSLPEELRIWFPHWFGQGASSWPPLCHWRRFPFRKKQLSWGLSFVEETLRAAKLHLDFGGSLIRVSNAPVCLEQSVSCMLPQHNLDRLLTFTLQSAPLERVNDAATVAIVHHGAQSPATWPSGVQRAAIVRLPSASAHNTVWCHPLTHHLLSDNLWYLPVGPEFFPLYSATIFSLAKCLTFSQVVMQGRVTENQGPQDLQTFCVRCPFTMWAFSCGISGPPQLMNFWTLRPLVCGWIVYLCHSFSSFPCLFFIPATETATFLLSDALKDLC